MCAWVIKCARTTQSISEDNVEVGRVMSDSPGSAMVACLACTPVFGSHEALVSLNKCADFNQLKQIHGIIIRNGLIHDQTVARKLLHLSSIYKKMDHANLIFNRIDNPMAFTWNVMIRAHTIDGSSQQALLLYNRMICRGVLPDKFTFPFVIKACVESCAVDKGMELHGAAIKLGFLSDMYVQNTLMDLYFKCGACDYGRKVFGKMRVRSVVSWTTMVSGLIACGQLDDAREICEQMSVRNVVSWTALIDGYVKMHRTQEAFELFKRMQIENVTPNEFTLVSLLQACTELSSLKLGRRIHDFAVKNGFNIGVFLGTALIDMYSKCGSLKNARKVFEIMQIKSLATWNSMITSLGVHGCGEEALSLFARLEKENVQPNAITFVGVLCACVNTNNWIEGHRYFKHMTERYDIVPIPEHYSSIAELDRCANMLDENFEVMKIVPMKDNDDCNVLLQGQSTIYGAADIELNKYFEELNLLAACTWCLFLDQFLCFKWDVG